jgi:hypothetical protein
MTREVRGKTHCFDRASELENYGQQTSLGVWAEQRQDVTKCESASKMRHNKDGKRLKRQPLGINKYKDSKDQETPTTLN